MSGIPYHNWTHLPKAQGGTDPIEFNNRPWARRSRGFADANLSVNNNTIVTVVFTNDYNMAAGESGADYFAAASNALRCVPDGVYLINAGVMWVEGHTSTVGIGVQDGAGAGHWNIAPHVSFTSVEHSFTYVHRYDGPQDITLTVFQSSGSAKNVDAAFLEIIYLGEWTGDNWEGMDPNQ